MLFAIGAAILAIGIIVNVVSDLGGLLLYLAWFLVRPQETWIGLGGSLPMERVFAICLLVGTLLRYKVFNPRPIVLTAPMKAFGALVVVNYLTIVFSIWRSNSLDTADRFGKLFLFFLCASIIVNTPKRFRIFLWTYILCLAWEAGSTVRNYYANPYFAQGIQRAEGLTETWGDPNAEAFNLVLVIPVMLAVRNANKKWKPTVIILGILATALVGIVLTGSRTGLFVLAAALTMMTLRSNKRFIMLPTLFFLAFFAWILMPAQYQERFETIFRFAANPTGQLNTSEGESAYGRIVGFRVAMMIFRDYPILGVGVGNFPDAWFTLPYSYQGQKGWHQPHNLPGQVLSEQGLAGGIAFIAFVVIVLRTSGAAGRLLAGLRDPPPILGEVNRMVPVLITCMLLQGFSSHSYYRYNWYLVCTLVGLIAQLAAQESSASEAAASPLAETQLGGVGSRRGAQPSATKLGNRVETGPSARKAV